MLIMKASPTKATYGVYYKKEVIKHCPTKREAQALVDQLSAKHGKLL